MRKFWIFAILIGVHFNAHSQEYMKGNSFAFGWAVDPVLLPLPAPQDIISVESVSKVLNIVKEKIEIKPVNKPGDLKSKSCFYNWIDPSTPDAAMLFQISTNPVYSEVYNYISMTVQSKIENGENFGAGGNINFKEEYIGKVRIAYSIQNPRIYWNIGDNYLMMLAFNMTNLSEEKILEYAHRFVPEINKNFLAKLLE